MIESEKLSSRVMPHSLELEQQVLGSIIRDDKCFDDVMMYIQSGDYFYKKAHRSIFDEMIYLKDNRVGVDKSTLSDSLKSNGRLDGIGQGYLSVLETSVSNPKNVESYAKRVQDFFHKRELISMCGTGLDMSFSEKDTVEDVLEMVEQWLYQISQGTTSDNIKPLIEITENTMKLIDEAMESEEPIAGLSTGFYELDELTGGFRNSNLIYIAGRPSMGKSALAVCMLMHQIMIKEKNGMFFSIEMSADNVMRRMLSILSEVHLSDILNGRLNDSDYNLVKKARADIEKSNDRFFIDDTPEMNVIEIKSKARRQARNSGLDVCLIDYLQYISAPKFLMSATENLQLQYTSRALKQMSRELDIPVVCLAQLSRAVESRPDKRPMLSDIRGSGSVEQDADLLMFVYRGEYYEPTNEELFGLAEVIVGKGRNSGVGTVELQYIKHLTKFMDK